MSRASSQPPNDMSARGHEQQPSSGSAGQASYESTFQINKKIRSLTAQHKGLQEEIEYSVVLAPRVEEIIRSKLDDMVSGLNTAVKTLFQERTGDGSTVDTLTRTDIAGPQKVKQIGKIFRAAYVEPKRDQVKVIESTIEALKEMRPAFAAQAVTQEEPRQAEQRRSGKRKGRGEEHEAPTKEQVGANAGLQTPESIPPQTPTRRDRHADGSATRSGIKRIRTESRAVPVISIPDDDEDEDDVNTPEFEQMELTPSRPRQYEDFCGPFVLSNVSHDQGTAVSTMRRELYIDQTHICIVENVSSRIKRELSGWKHRLHRVNASEGVLAIREGNFVAWFRRREDVPAVMAADALHSLLRKARNSTHQPRSSDVHSSP